MNPKNYKYNKLLLIDIKNIYIINIEILKIIEKAFKT